MLFKVLESLDLRLKSSPIQIFLSNQAYYFGIKFLRSRTVKIAVLLPLLLL